ncbi:hypothetical protein HHI36_012002, partial [Cryptolaemus montrouzieri]
DLKFVSSNRPGVKKGDPVVTDLRCIRCEPDGSLKFKLLCSDTFLDLLSTIAQPSAEIHVEQLYKTRLPIEATKFKHLQEIQCNEDQ